ncbi:MAG: hypothetical protein ACM3U2_09380, partial [Deltaproteobacteria bacterium]
ADSRTLLILNFIIPHSRNFAMSENSTVTMLQSRLEQIQQELSRERRRVARATRLTAVVGLLALILLSVYFYYGYHEFAYATEPEHVVDAAEVVIDSHLPEARRSLESQIIKSAPEWAEGLSKQAQNAIPQARQKLTDHFVEAADQATQESLIMSEDKYRGFLRDNRPMLEKKFKELGKDPNLAEQSLLELQVPLEAKLGTAMKVDAAALSKDIASVTRNLNNLAANKNLTPEQQVERRVWMIARRLQMEAEKSPEKLLPK